MNSLCDKKYQHFTPYTIAELIVNLIPVDCPRNIVDLSVGEGVFIEAANNRWKNSFFFGIDIDKSVIKKCKRKFNKNAFFFCGDSLRDYKYKNWYLYHNIKASSKFCLALGNPPFDFFYGKLLDKEFLKYYSLATEFDINNANIPLESLFIEKYLEVIKEYGFIAIIVPYGIMSNKNYKYIREYILRNTIILHIIRLPQKAFNSTVVRTQVLILQKVPEVINDNYQIELMDIDDNCRILNRINVDSNDLSHRMDADYYFFKNSISNSLNITVSMKKVKDLPISIRRGLTEYGEKRFFVEQGYRYLHTYHINDIGIDYSKKELFIQPESIMDKKNAYVKSGNIVLCRVGNNCIGRVGIINGTYEEGIASDCLFIIETNNCVNPYYLTIYLKTSIVRSSISRLKRGVCAASFNIDDFKEIEIPTVPMEFQKYIGNRFKCLLNNYNKLKQKEKKYTVYKERVIELTKLVERYCYGEIIYEKGVIGLRPSTL